MQMQEAEGGSPWPSLSPWPKPMAPALTVSGRVSGCICAHGPHPGGCGPGCHQCRNQKQLLHHDAGGWLVVVTAIYMSDISGAHLNPVLSLAICPLGHIPWARLPIYSLVQLLSAFYVSGATYVLYYDALQNCTSGNLTMTGPNETASIFATYPAPYLSLNNGFLDQVGVRGRPGSPNLCSVQLDPNLSFRLWVGCLAGLLFAPSPTPAARVGQSADMGR